MPIRQEHEMSLRSRIGRDRSSFSFPIPYTPGPRLIRTEDFRGADGSIPVGWFDGFAFDDTGFEPMCIVDHGFGCLFPRSRVGTYAPDQTSPEPGELIHGVGCWWTECDDEAVYVEIEWNGLHNQTEGFPYHMECGPAVHVTPGTSEHDYGMWPSVPFLVPVMLYGTISNPVEGFAVDDTAGFPHVDGQNHRLGIRTDGVGMTFFFDGEQDVLDGAGTDPLLVPASLIGSTLHGLNGDFHFTDAELIPNFPAAFQWVMKPLSTVVGTDTFTGANGTDLADHTPELGTWVDAADSFEIQSNRCAPTGVSGQALMTGGATGKIELDCPVAPNTSGIVVHFIDVNNHIIIAPIVGVWFMLEITGGAAAQAINTGVVAANNQHLAIRFSGEHVTFCIDGELIDTMSGIAANKQSVAVHGLRNASTGNTARFDNWSMTSVQDGI